MNQYHEVPSVLTTGVELVSPHLAWLIRCAVLEHCGSENVDLIAFSKNIPDNLFGKAFAGVKGIVGNLEMHALSAMDRCQLPENMHASLRALFIHEILDTYLHEADHLLSSSETGDWSKSEINEERARSVGIVKSWGAAKNWDVDIRILGSVVDEIFNDFIMSIREDAKDQVGDKIVMWKELQLFMWDNNLGYYDPDKDLSLSMHDTFEALAKDENPWISNPTKFIDTLMPEETEVPKLALPEEVAARLSEIAAMAERPVYQEKIVPVVEQDVYDGYDEPVPENIEYNDAYMGEEISDIPSYQTPAPVEKAPTLAPIQSAKAQEIVQIAEKVLRTLFWHVQNKCEFTQEGTYNNPTAVLEPVRIDHIPGALELFTHMNIYDANGKYANNQPTTAGIKGVITATGMPSYKLFLRMNGKLHYRTFLCANPNKINAATQQLSKWAQDARAGARIMYLLTDKNEEGMKAIVRLDPGKVLGQESFSIPTVNK